MAARCLAVHETIAANTCHIACLQETKLQHLDDGLACFLGAYRLNCFAYKPALGTRGGILILAVFGWISWNFFSIFDY